MSEILKQSSQNIAFRVYDASEVPYYYNPDTEEKTDRSASVFHGSGTTLKLYDNPAFWGPIRPMGLEVYFKRNKHDYLGFGPFDGSITFKLCNTPERTSGVYFKITRTNDDSLLFHNTGNYYDNQFIFGEAAEGYSETLIHPQNWYSGTPAIVVTGGNGTEPAFYDHSLTCAENFTERTLLEFGVIGQEPIKRDISLIRGAYWLRLGVFQEPEISGQTTAYSCLSMVTDTEHLELLVQPGISFCNSETKIPTTYGEMTTTTTKDQLRRVLVSSFASRYTVFFNSGEIGRKANQDVFLRENGLSDGYSETTSYNPNTFRHKSIVHPDKPPYASDLRHANTDCSELHGNWLTVGPPTKDSRQVHQHGTSGCKTLGYASHTPSFDTERTSLTVKIDLDARATFSMAGLDLNEPQKLIGDENSTLIDADGTFTPESNKVNTYIVHDPCTEITINQPDDPSDWSFVSVQLEIINPKTTEITRTVKFNEPQEEIELGPSRLFLIFDPTVEKWISQLSEPFFYIGVHSMMPIAYRLGEVECSNFIDGTQLAPYGFYGKQQGEELENRTKITFPVWQAFQRYPLTVDYIHGINISSYRSRPTSWWRPVDVVWTGANYYPHQLEVNPIERTYSLESWWNLVAEESAKYMDGRENFSFGTYFEAGTKTLTWENEVEYPEGTVVDLNYQNWHPTAPFQDDFADFNVSPTHTYGWKEHVVTESVSQWWHFTPLYDIEEGEYPNNPENDGDKSTVMLSGNLDVENEGGESWQNSFVSAERLRLDGVLQFTRRRDADSFKRYGISAAKKSWSEEEVVQCSETNPWDGQGFVARTVGISYEGLGYFQKTPWDNFSGLEASIAASGLKVGGFNAVDAELDAAFTQIPYTDASQSVASDVGSVVIRRYLSSWRVRVYFSQEKSEQLKNGQAVTIPCKVFRTEDDDFLYEGWRVSGVGNPTQDVVLITTLPGGLPNLNNFSNHLGSDGKRLAETNEYPEDFFDGCQMTFTLS